MPGHRGGVIVTASDGDGLVSRLSRHAPQDQHETG
jgi:hypothetical protein